MIASKEFYFDHLVIGSGLAGLSTALMLAEKTQGSIAIVTKGAIDDCNSKMAQGGIACVTDENDTFEEHLEDTLAAGAHLCRRDAVLDIVRKGPERIKWLIELGTHFTTRAEMGDTDPAGQDEFDLG
ncbi:MAG: FAD-binding protein, partial [Lentisphaeria bacterium]|nr:FAD-binding protein [Lentisphaeria bacterium]